MKELSVMLILMLLALGFADARVPKVGDQVSIETSKSGDNLIEGQITDIENGSICLNAINSYDKSYYDVCVGIGSIERLVWSPQEKQSKGKDIEFYLIILEGSLNGPRLPGVQITGKDGAGNEFDQTTEDPGGIVSLKGSQGTWHFEASKDGYQTRTWDLNIVDNTIRYQFLLKGQPPVTQDAVTWVDKGLVFACRGEWSDAIQALDKATNLDPSHSTAWSLKSYCLYMQGRYQEALQSLERFLELVPNEPYELYNKGVVLQELGRTEEAAEAFQSAKQYGCGYDDQQYHWNLNCQDFQKDLETRLGMDETTVGPEQQDQSAGTIIPLKPNVGCHKNPITGQVICNDNASVFSKNQVVTETANGVGLNYRDFYSIGGCNPKDYLLNPPPVPRYLPDPNTGTISKVPNTYGYDWIYLPGMEKCYDQSYLDWIKAWVDHSNVYS